jgi:hypothetical protein
MNNIEILINRLKELKNQYFKNNSASINQVFTVSPKIQMNLLLNFESYEVITKTEDTYMPEEKIVNFNIGKLKLHFVGKLRITQPRHNGQPLPYNKNKIPFSTYGVIESDSKLLLYIIIFVFRPNN